MAIVHAIDTNQNNRLRTHNVHSEILYALSPNTSISEALQVFGPGKNRELVLVRVGGTLQEAQTDADALVKGIRGEWSSYSDTQRIHTVYKLQPETVDALGVVLGSMAIKGLGHAH
jgi:EKC/KEOPS complex subunit CGI121/TPRKB